MTKNQKPYDPRQFYMDRIEIFLSSLKLLIVISGVFIVASFAGSITWLGFLGFVLFFVAVAIIHEEFIKKRNYAARQFYHLVSS